MSFKVVEYTLQSLLVSIRTKQTPQAVNLFVVQYFLFQSFHVEIKIKVDNNRKQFVLYKNTPCFQLQKVNLESQMSICM